MAILVADNSPIKSVADLGGKRVVLNKGSNVHYLLVRALENAGLKYSDIHPIYLAPADARAAMMSPLNLNQTGVVELSSAGPEVS